MHKFTTYTINASLDTGSTLLGLSQAEVLGEAYNKVYTSEDDATDECTSLIEMLEDEDNTLDPQIEYSVVPTEHTVELDFESVELVGNDEDKPVSSYCYYIQMGIKLDGDRKTICVVVGARESDHGTIKACNGSVGPFCSAWWEDSTDHADLPKWAVEEVFEAISKNKMKLYRIADALVPEE